LSRWKFSIESVLGVKSERLADAYADLAWAYSKVPRYRDAIQAENQAIALRSELLKDGAKDPNVLILKAHVGEFLAKDKQYTRADKYLADTLAVANESQSPEPVSKAYILEAMAKSFIMQKKWNQAEQVALQIVPIDDRLLAAGRTCFDGRELVAEIYARSGKWDDAIKQAYDSLDAKNQHKDSNNVSLAIAYETVGKVLVSANQRDAARGEFDKALELLKKEYGAKSEKVSYWGARYKHLLNERDPFDQ
jgi:tetratricopeptide (TPR) repeat protein